MASVVQALGYSLLRTLDGLQLDRRKVLQLLDQLAGGLERRNVKAEMFIYRYRGASVPRRPTLCRQC